MLVSPGLSVITYLQKFKEIIVSIKKMVLNKDNWLSGPLKKTIINPIAKQKNIIPIISESPATAWLKNPILFIANSSVKLVAEKNNKIN